MSRPLSNAEAEAIFDLLVKHAGARENMRYEFVRAHIEKSWYGYPTEFRFQGDLGFGGKFWNGYGKDGWAVTCYSEDNTKYGEKVKRLNVLLADLRRKFYLEAAGLPPEETSG